MGRKRILFVDDEPLVLRSFEAIMRQEATSWDSVFALGGEAGLSALEQGVFDVVVSDYAMPVANGILVLAAAKDASPGAVRILCTGSIIDAKVDAHFVLAKPLDRKLLHDVLEGVVDALEAPPDPS